MATTGPTGPTGQLRLTSEPSGATVLVTVPNRSGRAAAVAPITTPATLDLSPGEHSITVSKDGASVTGTAVIEKDVGRHGARHPGRDRRHVPRTAYYRFFYHSFIEGHPFYAHETGCAMGWQAGTSPVGGNPPYTLSITGLPPGMVFDDKEVTVYGTPAAEG